MTQSNLPLVGIFDDPAKAAHVIEQLREAGFRFARDWPNSAKASKVGA